MSIEGQGHFLTIYFPGFVCTRPRYQVSVYRTIGPLVYSNQIRTLVAMATYSSHRLIMGKEEIDIFCLIGDILIFFYRNVY